MMSGADQPATRIFAALLEARTGQQLSPSRSWRIEAALRPLLDAYDCQTIAQLAERVAGGRDSELATHVVDALVNNETSFFRDAAVFDGLRRDGLERLREMRADTRFLRIWSAACSTGQEVYSLALIFREEAARWAGWTIDILGSDVSAPAVGRARSGHYNQFEIQRGLPVRTMLDWFTQRGEDWWVDPMLQRHVRFQVHNLFDPPPGRFDLILCRNVLIHFPPEGRDRVFAQLASALVPDGVLMLGAGETTMGQTDRFVPHPEMRGFYSHAIERASSLPRAAAR